MPSFARAVRNVFWWGSLGLGVLQLSSCSSMPVRAFADQRPIFDPIKFWSGRTRSSGVMETRGGAPMQTVRTETHGHFEGDIFHLEQDLTFGGGKRSHRSWRMRRIDAHHFIATANDMVGEARGEAWGNAFHWSFTLALSRGNPLSHVRMSQWMYLQPDGRTLLNHTTIRKAGFVVAQVTEQFQPVP